MRRGPVETVDAMSQLPPISASASWFPEGGRVSAAGSTMTTTTASTHSDLKTMDSFEDILEKSIGKNNGSILEPTIGSQSATSMVRPSYRFQATATSRCRSSQFYASPEPGAAPASPAPRWRFPSDLEDPESAAPAAASGASVPRGRTGLPSEWTLTDQYQLPDFKSYTLRGQLHRLKGRWKKKWESEWVLVQSNILLTCTREEPYLVNLCIPLRNIQGVERGSGSFLDLRYVRATRRQRLEVAVTRFRANSPAEADNVVRALRTHWQAAQRSAVLLGDFVERSCAENKIQSLYDTVKNGALKQLATRLSNAVSLNRQLCLRGVLFALKNMSCKAVCAARVAACEAATADAAAAARAERLAAGSGAVVLALMAFVRSRRQAAFLYFKRKIDSLRFDALTRATRSILVDTLATNQEHVARQYVMLREQRLGTALRLPFQRIIQEAFFRFRDQSYMMATCSVLRSSALRAIVSDRIAEQRQRLVKVVCNWKYIVRIHALREQALKSFLLARSDAVRSQCVHVWKVACAMRSEKDFRAIQTLADLFSRHSSASLVLAFSSWARHTAAAHQAEMLQLAANIVRVNDAFVAKFDHVAKERTCHRLASAMSCLYRSHLLSTFRVLRGHSDYQTRRRQCFALGAAILHQQYRRKLHRTFFTLLQHILLHDRQRLSNARKQMLYGAVLGDAKERGPKRFEGLAGMTGARNPVAVVVVAVSCMVDRLRLRQLIIGFGALTTHRFETSMLRGLLRTQHLQHLVHVTERFRAAALATAFTRWHSVLLSGSPTNALQFKPLLGRATVPERSLTPPPLRTKLGSIQSSPSRSAYYSETKTPFSKETVESKKTNRAQKHSASPSQRVATQNRAELLGNDVKSLRCYRGVSVEQRVLGSKKSERQAHWGTVTLTNVCGLPLRHGSHQRAASVLPDKCRPVRSSVAGHETETRIMPCRTTAPATRFVSLSPEPRCATRLDDFAALTAVLRSPPYRPKSYLALLPNATQRQNAPSVVFHSPRTVPRCPSVSPSRMRCTSKLVCSPEVRGRMPVAAQHSFTSCQQERPAPHLTISTTHTPSTIVQSRNYQEITLPPVWNASSMTHLGAASLVSCTHEEFPCRSYNSSPSYSCHGRYSTSKSAVATPLLYTRATQDASRKHFSETTPSKVCRSSRSVPRNVHVPCYSTLGLKPLKPTISSAKGVPVTKHLVSRIAHPAVFDSAPHW